MLDKKMIFVFAAIISFFACSVLAGNHPAIVSLTTFLATGIGFVCGYFCNRVGAKEAINDLRATISSMEEEYKKLSKETDFLKEENKKFVETAAKPVEKDSEGLVEKPKEKTTKKIPKTKKIVKE